MAHPRKRRRRIIASCLLFYVSSFLLLDVAGSYRLIGDDMGRISWVWRGVFMWHAPEDKFSERYQRPTLIGVVYLPLDVAQYLTLDYHKTLTAFVPAADGIYFDYPEMGLTWENHGHTIDKKSHFVGYVEIPGANSREALRKYKELK